MNETKVLRILYIVITLLVINTTTLVYLVFRSTQNLAQPTAPSVARSDTITKDQAQVLGKLVVERYNANDAQGLYARFDDLAKLQMGADKVTDALQKLHKIAGNIDDFAYSHNEFSGKKDGKDFYTLFYKLRLSGGSLPVGEMKIAVTQEDNQLKLYGFFINALEQ